MRHKNPSCRENSKQLVHRNSETMMEALLKLNRLSLCILMLPMKKMPANNNIKNPHTTTLKSPNNCLERKYDPTGTCCQLSNIQEGGKYHKLKKVQIFKIIYIYIYKLRKVQKLNSRKGKDEAYEANIYY